MAAVIQQQSGYAKPLGVVGGLNQLSSASTQQARPDLEIDFTTPPKEREPTQVWKTLAKCLPSRNPDCDYWWNLTGRHMAYMVEAAGYTTEKQYEALLYYYHWAVPYLGPSPATNGGICNWRSKLTVDGTPLDYSWKWNTSTAKPVVRFTMEPMNRFTGTDLDPINQLPARELLHQLDRVHDSSDLTLVDYFFSAFFDHDKAGYVREKAQGARLVTSVSVSFAFDPSGLSFKTYFVPRKLGQVGLWPLEQWGKAIRGVEPGNAALDLVDKFLATSAEGKLLRPFMLAVDNVRPASSRLKFYFQSPHTSFDSVREIMTLGGRITGVDAQLADLRELVHVVLGLPLDFPEDAEVPDEQRDVYIPAAKDVLVDLPELPGYMCYFDIAPGASVPDIKFYIPTRRYGRNDRVVAEGINGWMKARGRGAHGQKFLDMLESVAEHRGLDAGCLQTFVSCRFRKDGQLDVTTYFAPEAYHPALVGGGKTANGVH